MKKESSLKKILDTTRPIWDRPETRLAVRRNFAAVIDCGTPALGWDVYASGTEEKCCYYTCKSRFCPSCGYRATLHWLAELEAFLPDIPYSGIVFTMPRELWAIFRRNRHLLHDLPALGAGVIQQWTRSRYGVSVGIIVVPHTFGGDLKFNAHLHILLTGGGFHQPTGHWIPRVRLNKDALMRMWRYAVITHLRAALKAHVLKSDLDTLETNAILTRAYERHPRWIIFIDELASKAHFLRYAARYVRRPPIATWRLLKVTSQEVEFVAKDTKAKRQIRRRCQLSDFLRLLASHVPDKSKKAVRYFGLWAPRSKGETFDALLYLLGETRRTCPQRLSWRDSILKYFGYDPLMDSRGQQMNWVRRERRLP